MPQFISTHVGGLMIGNNKSKNVTAFCNIQDIAPSTVAIGSDLERREYIEETISNLNNLVGIVCVDEDSYIVKLTQPYIAATSLSAGQYRVYIDRERGNYFFMVYDGEENTML